MLRRTCMSFTEKVLCEDFPHARLLTLNKTKSLNALDLDMARALHKYLIGAPLAEKDALYIMKGAGGKAFCAGGDVVNITQNNPPGIGREFFYLECQLACHLNSMRCNNIALWDGFVMGAGSGVSVPGKYRIATERAVVAMPETGIGMVHEGGSWYLPRLPTPGLGLFMALTQHRVKGADLIHTGIATHFVPSEKLDSLEKDLCHIENPALLDEVLGSYTPSTMLPPSSYDTEELQFLAETFTVTPATTMLSIVEKVEAAKGKNELATEASKAFTKMSPLAMALTLEMLKRGARAKSCEESLVADYCVSQRISVGSEFKEGVRALLIDKDLAPKWERATIADVTAEDVEKYFVPTTPEQVVWDPIKPLPPIS